jgi:hypothetical protein
MRAFDARFELPVDTRLREPDPHNHVLPIHVD